MRISPIFNPNEKPVRSGYYCAYASRQPYLLAAHKLALRCGVVEFEDLYYYSVDEDLWYYYSYTDQMTPDQNRYWFGVVKED